MMTSYEQLSRLITWIKAQQHKVKLKDRPLSLKESRRLGSLKRCLLNIKEDGFLGGESGVNLEHIERELSWVKSNIRTWYPGFKGIAAPGDWHVI